MPDRYPHFWGGSQICGQSAPPVKATNGEKLKMLNCKFSCISDPAANTMQTTVIHPIKIPFQVPKVVESAPASHLPPLDSHGGLQELRRRLGDIRSALYTSC